MTDVQSTHHKNNANNNLTPLQPKSILRKPPVKINESRLSGVSVPTSAWAHNCGMHAIADFMIEEIQQDNFGVVFSGAAYDHLLASFQVQYHNPTLTWPTIRQISMQTSREDAQIMWGFALRMILPNIIERSPNYKKDLRRHFVAAVGLFNDGEYEELEGSYPIIFYGNQYYFYAQRSAPHSKSKIEKYWNNIGFGNYCTALLYSRSNLGGDQNLLWLGTDELATCCAYFGIQAEINGFMPNNIAGNIAKRNKMVFVNSGTHWERQVALLTPEDKNKTYSRSRFFTKDFYLTVFNIFKIILLK